MENWHLLIRRIAEGDEEAMQELYLAAGPLLFGWARRTHPDLDPEDFYNHSMAKVWLSAASCRVESHSQTKNWVFTIFKNLIRDYLRSMWARNVDLIEQDEDLEAPRPAENGWVDSLDFKLWPAQHLDQRQQIIHDLRLKGYRQWEIGEQLGLSTVRVNQIIKEIDQKIFEYYQERDEPPPE